MPVVWATGPLFETDCITFFFSTLYPESREVETSKEVWWYFRLRVTRGCIKIVVMGIKGTPVGSTGIRNSSADLVMKIRKSILHLLGVVISDI